MHRVDSLILYLLFSGGTVMAAGSVLGSIKRSMSATPQPEAGYRVVAERVLPADSPPSSKDEFIAAPTMLALPAPESEPMEAGEVIKPLEKDTSRNGKNRKKARRAEPRRSDQGRRDREAQPQVRKRKNNRPGG